MSCTGGITGQRPATRSPVDHHVEQVRHPLGGLRSEPPQERDEREQVGRRDVRAEDAVAHPRVEEPLDRVDVNLVGVLNGIAAALPVFREQGSGHSVHTASTSAHRIVPAQGVYAATKTAVRVLSEALRQEAGPHLRVTVVSPGFTATEGVTKTDDPEQRALLEAQRDALAMPADAVAAAVAYAIAQPAGVDVGEVVVRPTAQS